MWAYFQVFHISCLLVWFLMCLFVLNLTFVFLFFCYLFLKKKKMKALFHFLSLFSQTWEHIVNNQLSTLFITFLSFTFFHFTFHSKNTLENRVLELWDEEREDRSTITIQRVSKSSNDILWCPSWWGFSEIDILFTTVGGSHMSIYELILIHGKYY